MSIVVARTQPMPLLGPFPRPVRSLQIFDQSSCGYTVYLPNFSDAVISSPRRLTSSSMIQPPEKLDRKRKEVGSVESLSKKSSSIFSRDAHLLKRFHSRRSTLTSTNVIACGCRFPGPSGGENAGRFEEGETGVFGDPALNCKGEKKRPGGGSGMKIDFEVRDSAKSLPWKSSEDGLRTGFSSGGSESFKERGWPGPSCSWLKESPMSPSPSCPPTNPTVSWVERNEGHSALPRADENLVRKTVGTAGIPMSLRMLKRKQGRNRAQRNLNDGDALRESSFKKAFSSMVFMIRTLQSYTIHLRLGEFYEDMNETLASVQRELYSSYLWLFPQVFACTPKLMLAVMVLLANYTVFSMGNNVALGAVSSPAAVVSVSHDSRHVEYMIANRAFMGRQELERTFENFDDLLDGRSPSPMENIRNVSTDSWFPFQTESGAGGSNRRVVEVSGGADRPWQSANSSPRRPMFSDQELNVADAQSLVEQDEVVQKVQGTEEVLFQTEDSVTLDHDTKQRLVAPVHAKLEPDNYSCYDRTELIYQYAIATDAASNAMLLANYARFLFLVRHDHDRAEQLFTRAIRADPTDGDAIGCYASFLWLARGDRLAAEKAYRAALDLDPSNPFNVGSYANFLWHAGDEEMSCPVTPAACKVIQSSMTSF